MNIVIVDDEPKKFLVPGIEGIGNHTVTEIHDLDEAYKYISENKWKIDLVFIDEVFKNLDASSKLRSGFGLGMAMLKETSFIPKVMFTANAYSAELSTEASVEGEFIDFISKAVVSQKNISSILDRVTKRKGFAQKKIQKKEARALVLKERFKALNPTQRDNLRTKLGKNYRFLGEVIDIGAGFRMDVNEWLEGYCDMDVINNEGVKKILAEFLHLTEATIVFKGEWQKEDSETRRLLSAYESSPDYKNERHAIDVAAFNWLMEVLTIRWKFTGEHNIRLSKTMALSGITRKCLPGRNNDIIFQQKLIARRVIIGHRRIIKNEYDRLPLINLINLLIDGWTGTYVKDNGANKNYKDHGDIPAGKQPKSVLNNNLGLGYASQEVEILPAEEERARGKKQKVDKNRVKLIEYFAEVDPPNILYEEEAFWSQIGQHVEELQKFFLIFQPPENSLPNHYEVGNLIVLDDLEKLLIDSKAYSKAGYRLLVDHLRQELSNQNATLTGVLEYLLKMSLQ
ncbi:MAG TPA: hypothetical protein VHC96_21660 [Puia sp.]|nr:hypothetical protein [Puia sp.]